MDRTSEGRNTLLETAYAAARAARLELLENGTGRFSRKTGPDDAAGHAELNRVAPNLAIAKGGYVHVAVSANESASTGRPLHLPVDRIALTRHRWAYAPRASGTVHDLDRLLHEGPETRSAATREWATEWVAEITGVRIERAAADTAARLAWRRRADGARGDERGLDTAAAGLAALAIWATAHTGLVANELPETGLTHGQALEAARLLAALGADGCDVWISTDSDVVLEELGAIATDSHVRRTGERGGTLPRQDELLDACIDLAASRRRRRARGSKPRWPACGS